MVWVTGIVYTGEIFQVLRIWYFPDAERSFLYTGVFGINTTVHVDHPHHPIYGSGRQNYEKM